MRDLMRSSNLATPFARMIVSPRCYYLIRSQRPLGNPAVNAIEKWLRREAAQSATLTPRESVAARPVKRS